MEAMILTGDNLTIDLVQQIATDESITITIHPDTMEKLQKARQLVFDLVDADFPIYGFNVGVGWNKDKKVFKEFFSQYNSNLIRSHCIGVPPYASIEKTRAIMLARLNTMLVGCTGVAPEIPEMLVQFLNHHIYPLIPERGSVGQGDIGLLSHIGLALIGEGTVIYNGKQQGAQEAMAAAGLTPVTLGPKDGLAIVSSNALAAGEGALVLKEIEDLLCATDLIYAMSLEGFGGNTSPLDEKNHLLRKYYGQGQTATLVRTHLEGSDLFHPNKQKAVHDPLCYRNYAQVVGAVRESLDYVKERMEIQLNTTEDNPCVFVEEGTILASANFEPLNWVLGFETLGIALSHLSKHSCQRIIKLSDPSFTELPRFLSPRVETLGFATIQKTFTALDAEIRHLCNPTSMDTFSLAGDMEDVSCNSPYVVQKLANIVDNLTYILALELIHGAQAMDYRKEHHMGKNTKKLYEKVRERILFYDQDTNLTTLILKAYELIKNKEILKLL